MAMSNWDETRLGKVIKVNPPVKLVKGEIYPFIDIDKLSTTNSYVSNIEIKHYNGQGCSKFENSDTIFSRITPCLENRKIAQTKLVGGNKAFGSTEFYVFRGIKGITNNEFVYYLVSSDIVVLPAISSMTGASGRQRADRGFIERIKIKLPPLPTQQKIADILSAYDDLIENNNRRIELLEKAAQDIYKEWFVRMRFPNHENVEFENGLPIDWKVIKLDDILQIIDGDRGMNYPKQNEFMPDGYCLFLNAGNVTINGFDFSNNNFISKENDLKLRKGKLIRNDIVVTTRGTIGNIAYYNKYVPYTNIRINSGMVIIREKIHEVNSIFLYHLLKSYSVKKAFEQYSSGSAQPQLPIKDMKRVKVILPTIDLIKQYLYKVNDIENLIGNLNAQNFNLKRQRDLLLPRLMSGKLEV